MIVIRPAKDRGATKIDWLKSFHTFSFGGYQDPEHMGFGSLRVVNEDYVIPGAGFKPHPHENMEIISYVLEGALEHQDSEGNGSIILAGDVQRMSAGTGITHSEFNHSATQPVHFLQIWFLPKAKGIAPGYEQKSFAKSDKLNRFLLVASHSGRDGSVSLHQDVDMAIAVLDGSQSLSYKIQPGHKVWVQIARGSVSMGADALQAGDGAAVSDEASLTFITHDSAEIVIFEMKV